MKKILLVGGGSIGHVAPLVAVARALRTMDPSADLHIVCAERKEESLFLEQEDLPFSTLPLVRRNWKILLRMPQVLLQAKRMLEAQKPAVIFSKGGSISVPLCIAARTLHIPIVLHESDAVSAYANRIVGTWAKVICQGFPVKQETTHRRRHTTKWIFTGNPVRPDVLTGRREEGLRLTGLTGTRPILLITGGSQGAQALNDAVIDHLDTLLTHCDIVHLTGKGKEREIERNGYWSRTFVQSDLPYLYSIAGIALTRAGAGTIAEMAAYGIPAILVPLRGVGHDHQQANAERVQALGGCILLDQKKIDAALVPTITSLLRDTGERARLSQGIRAFYQSDAAEHLARIVLSTSVKNTPYGSAL